MGYCCLPLILWQHLIPISRCLFAWFWVARSWAYHLFICKIIKFIYCSTEGIIQRGWVLMLDVLNACRPMTLTEIRIETFVSRVEMKIKSLRYLTHTNRFHWIVEDVVGTLLMFSTIAGSAVISPKGSIPSSLVCERVIVKVTPLVCIWVNWYLTATYIALWLLGRLGCQILTGCSWSNAMEFVSILLIFLLVLMYRWSLIWIEFVSWLTVLIFGP